MVTTYNNVHTYSRHEGALESPLAKPRQQSGLADARIPDYQHLVDDANMLLVVRVHLQVHV